MLPSKEMLAPSALLKKQQPPASSPASSSKLAPSNLMPNEIADNVSQLNKVAGNVPLTDISKNNISRPSISNMAKESSANFDSDASGLPKYGSNASSFKPSTSERKKSIATSLSSGYLAPENDSETNGTGSNYWGEEFDDNDGNALDPRIDLVGNTSQNDAYIRDALENGASEDDLYNIMHRDPWWKLIGEAVRGGKKSGAGTIRNIRGNVAAPPNDYRDSYDINKNSIGLESHAVLDDGSSYDYAHMTADNMTGTQYLHYVVDLGMPGRPAGEIDPAGTYSKSREAVNYGFTPFVPDWLSLANQVGSNALDTVHRIGAAAGSARQIFSPDYRINYGNGNSISGKDFDRLATAYLNQIAYNLEYHPERLIDKQSTPYITEYAIPDANGNMRYAYGVVVDSGVGDDGVFYLEFSDGQKFGVSDEYMDENIENGQLNLNPRSITPDEAMGYVPEDILYDSLNLPDLILPDGTAMSYEDVWRIYYDANTYDDPANEYDDDITYDFLPNLNPATLSPELRTAIPLLEQFAIPRRLMDQEITRSTGRSLADHAGDIPIIGDYVSPILEKTPLNDINGSTLNRNFNPVSVVDWTLGSLPISLSTEFWSPWLYSASNGLKSLSGVDPATYDPITDSYRLIAGGWDDGGNLRYGVTGADKDTSDMLKLWNALGNTAVPLTENIAGNIGSDPFKKFLISTGLVKALPANPLVNQLVSHAIIDAIGEGIEEVIGIPFDEFTTYGPSGMYADQLTDEFGNPLYDDSNAEVRDYNTPLYNRVVNALDPSEIANAFAGGVGVSALMGNTPGLSGERGPFLSQLADASRREAVLNASGATQSVDIPYEVGTSLAVPSEEYLSMFDDFDDLDDSDDYPRNAGSNDIYREVR